MERVVYGISASELDSRVASLWPPVIRINALERLAREYPARMNFGYGGGYDNSASELRSRVTEYFDEHGAVVRVEYNDDPYGNGCFGAVRASEAEIAKLPRAKAGEVRETDCAVCLESFEEGDELRTMICPSSHGFHQGCIFKWLRISRLCPLCRFALPAEEEGEC